MPESWINLEPSHPDDFGYTRDGYIEWQRKQLKLQRDQIEKLLDTIKQLKTQEIGFTREGYIMRDRGEIRQLKGWWPGYATIHVEGRESEFRAKLAGEKDLEELVSRIIEAGWKVPYYHFLDVAPFTVDEVFERFQKIMKDAP